MIHLELSKEQLDELHKQAAENPCIRARKKCWVVYLKGNGYAHQEIAKVVRVDEDSITEYLKKYRDGGLPGLLAENYRKGKGRLDAHAPKLKEVFAKNPPHTVNQAIAVIERETQVRLKHSACRAFLLKLGMKCLRCGLIPGNALGDDGEQRQKQRDFHDKKLQPLLEEAKQGKRTVLFVDAAHFVMGAFLGMLCYPQVPGANAITSWVLTIQFGKMPSPSPMTPSLTRRHFVPCLKRLPASMPVRNCPLR